METETGRPDLSRSRSTKGTHGCGKKSWLPPDDSPRPAALLRDPLHRVGRRYTDHFALARACGRRRVSDENLWSPATGAFDRGCQESEDLISLKWERINVTLGPLRPTAAMNPDLTHFILFVAAYLPCEWRWNVGRLSWLRTSLQ